jgi:hypothetical protein
MSKRFTDSKKWRNAWFRALPLKAKLAWIFLCDECESHGVIKLDYELASFQLGFDITPTLIRQWFGDKIFFFDIDKILIVQFFEFQYGESKDTWSAKAQARKKLEALGFTIENNKVVIPFDQTTPTVVDSGVTPLSIVIGIVNNNKKEDKNFEKEIEQAYSQHYPRKIGKQKGVEKLVGQIRSQHDVDQLVVAITRYKESIDPGTKPKFIKHFSTFANEWTDWLEADAGKAEVPGQEKADLSKIQWGKS